MTLSLPKTLLAVGFAAIAAIAVPEGTMTTPASAQSMGWTPFDQLAGAGEYGRVARQSRRIGGGGSQVRTSRNTLDVRGMRVHEAEAAVEEQLRSASGPLWVIHGIGTGKLKRGLRAWLDTVSYVERVTDAEQGDGGPGCSVVWVR